jgi:hypothetical protein
MATPWNEKAAVRAKGLQSHRDATEDDKPISTKANECETKFSDAVQLMKIAGEMKYAAILEKLQARFDDWKAYLGVFASGKASLDNRLAGHPRYRDLVLLALDMLNMNLSQSKADSDIGIP